MTYGSSSEAGKRFPATSPRLTAGFKWHPEMCPIAKAMVRTVSPKARATPAYPMPTLGTPAASTAEPHPPKTSQKVPKNSAAARLPIGMGDLLSRMKNMSLRGPVSSERKRVAQGDRNQKDETYLTQVRGEGGDIFLCGRCLKE